MGERILVTGGAGFIGSHLVDALLSAGHSVRVFDSLEPQVHGGLRERGAWPEYLAKDCEKIVGDVRDRVALQKAIGGMDVIFHEAAAVGVGQSMYEVHRYVDINTLGTANLLDILANEPHGVRKLMVASSMSIYGEGAYHCLVHGKVYPRLRPKTQLTARDWEMQCPVCGEHASPIPTDEEKPLFSTSIYAISKKDQEEMCLCIGRAYHVPVVALRYFNVYGPRQALSNPYTGVAAIFSSRLLNDNAPLVFEDGRQSRDFIHVSDIVQANILAMDTESANNDYFNVGTGRTITVLEVGQVLARALRKSIEPSIVQQFREGDIRHCVPDITKAQCVLGYQPRVSFEDGMQELAEWVNRQQAADDLVEKARLELTKRKLVA
jgi:dTDP-L-rhamnose 4-epimerase